MQFCNYSYDFGINCTPIRSITIINQSTTIPGYYMYIEASLPRTRGDNALLTSEEFFPTSSSGRCLKFWYHMYGVNIGSLKIYYKTNSTRQILWGLSGQQSSKHSDWKFGQAPIRSKVVYQVSCGREQELHES